MSSTSLGLLERLRHAGPAAAEWDRLRAIYSPMIRSWLERSRDFDQEVEDVTQEVLLVLFRELPTFERRRDGSFRAWLRLITVNRAFAHWKARRKEPPAAGGSETERFLARLADPDSDLARQWDHEHDQHLLRTLLAAAEQDFGRSTWLAFRRFALEGQPAAEVAAESGLTESAVVQAKFRVLKRLREVAGDLLD